MPGSSPTIERRLAVSRLKSVLLPTLGRPTMATSGNFAAPALTGTTDLRYVGKFFSSKRLSARKASHYQCTFWLCMGRNMRAARSMSSGNAVATKDEPFLISQHNFRPANCRFFKPEGAMHIHPAAVGLHAINTNALANERAATAQRAAETRKRLFKSAQSIDAASDPDATLMIGQWLDSRHSHVLPATNTTPRPKAMTPTWAEPARSPRSHSPATGHSCTCRSPLPLRRERCVHLNIAHLGEGGRSRAKVCH